MRRKERRKEGKKEGRKGGRKEGRKEGRQEGRKKERKEVSVSICIPVSRYHIHIAVIGFWNCSNKINKIIGQFTAQTHDMT